MPGRAAAMEPAIQITLGRSRTVRRDGRMPWDGDLRRVPGGQRPRLPALPHGGLEHRALQRANSSAEMLGWQAELHVADTAMACSGTRLVP